MMLQKRKTFITLQIIILILVAFTIAKGYQTITRADQNHKEILGTQSTKIQLKKLFNEALIAL